MAGCHGQFSSRMLSTYLDVAQLIVYLRRFSVEKPVLFTGTRYLPAVQSIGGNPLPRFRRVHPFACDSVTHCSRMRGGISKAFRR